MPVPSSETVSLEGVSSPCKAIYALASAPQPPHNFFFCLPVELRLDSDDKGHSNPTTPVTGRERQLQERLSFDLQSHAEH
jgi:hypothetical protein